MVRILGVQLRRFEAVRAPQGQLQHIGTAVAALISAAAVCRDLQERTKLLEALHVLADVAGAISPTYIPAEMIFSVLENLLQEPGWGCKRITNKEADEAMKEILNNMTAIGDDYFKSSMPLNPLPCGLSLENNARDLDYSFTRTDGMDLLPRLDQNDCSFGPSASLDSVLNGMPPSLSHPIIVCNDLSRM